MGTKRKKEKMMIFFCIGYFLINRVKFMYYTAYIYSFLRYRGCLNFANVVNPIPNGLNPRVVSMLDFCAYLAWPHFFSRTPRNFLMVSKQLHIRALSKCCEVSSCLVSLCLKNRGHLFNRGGI